MAVQIQLRNGTSAAWTLANPVLAIGEFGLETNTGLFKIGNGVNDWNTLPYGGLQGIPGVNGTNGTNGTDGSYVGNIDGGDSTSVYGGTYIIDGGNS
jgi:hypothetical protein